MDLNLQAADAYCRHLTRGHYENFIVSFGLLDQATRCDLSRFYAYCRTTDDLGDESGSHGLALLARWRGEVEALFRGAPPAHPVLVALAQTIARRNLPAQPFLDLIAANVQDQTVKAYETWSQLETYCMLSAAPVGRIVLRIFGLDGDDAIRLSDDVCVGLQLANHAQDVSRDARIGRTYLLAADVRDAGVRGAVRALCERARHLLASGRRLESLAPFTLRLQLALYRLGGVAICDAIERIGYDTETARPSVSGAARVAVVARALIDAASHHALRTGDVEPA
jgi:squalene synthase HpnC